METLTQDTNEPQEGILADVIDTTAYDKKVKSAQNTIFIVACVQLVAGLVTAFMGEAELQNIEIGVAVFISAVFAGLGFLCKLKPFTAIIIALTLYVGLLVFDAIFDPTTIIKGIIFKAFIISYLIKGIVAAKAARDIKNMMGK